MCEREREKERESKREKIEKKKSIYEIIIQKKGTKLLPSTYIITQK